MPTDEQRKVYALEYEDSYGCYVVDRIFSNEQAAKKALRRELKTAGSRGWAVTEYEVCDSAD